MATDGRGDGGEKVKRGGRGKGESGLAGGWRRGVEEEEEGRGSLSLSIGRVCAHSTASPSGDKVAERRRLPAGRRTREAFYEWTEAIIEASD